MADAQGTDSAAEPSGDFLSDVKVGDSQPDNAVDDDLETIKAALQMTDWKPKEEYEIHGQEVIGWITNDDGDNTTARLWYTCKKAPEHMTQWEPGWYWAETEEIVKRQDLIRGVIPWPEPG